MPFRMTHFCIAVLIFFSICVLASTALHPFSIINFVGPAAGAASALILLWGVRSLFAVFVGYVLFHVFLSLYYDYSVEPAVSVISLMAIVLQAFWTKQLSYKYIHNQRWLNSRALLFSFLTRVGPLAGGVSASATVLVAVLDAKILASSLFYAFFTSLAGSILIAVFLTPLLLFTQGQQKFTLLKRMFVIFSSSLACLAIAVLFFISQKSHQHLRLDHFEQAKDDVIYAMTKEMTGINHQVRALAALFMASDNVSAQEFSQFASQIHQSGSTVRSLEWVPAVAQENKALFEQYASEQLKQSYLITEQSVMGELIPALSRVLYFPVLYIYPRQSAISTLGLDLSIHSDKFSAMNEARRTEELVASAPVNLVQDDFSSPGSLMFYPLYNGANFNHFGENSRSNFIISGYILAVAQFDKFFQKLEQKLLKEQIEFFVLDNSDAAPYLLYGQDREYNNRLVEQLTVNVFSRQWQVTVFESQPWNAQIKPWQTWGLLLGGTLGGIFFQVLILMMAAYSTELSNQVMLKTRELVLAKEQSDQANSAKTKFLTTLAVEFKPPLNVMLAFIDSYHMKHLPEISKGAMRGLVRASQSMEHLVEHLTDLNSIESGKVTLTNQKLDLHRFIYRIEASFKASVRLNQQTLKVLLGKNVPQFIEVDEYRLQQLLTIITENAFALLQTAVVRLSVKAHMHKRASTSLFFVLTADETLLSEQNNLFTYDDNNNDIEGHSTAMAMVKELSQLLGGNAKIVNLPSSNSVISVSIRVTLPRVKKMTEFSVDNDKGAYDEVLTTKDVILASHDQDLIAELTGLFSQLDRKLDVFSNQQDIFKSLHQSSYKLMIIDDYDQRINAARLAEQIRGGYEHSDLIIIGIFSERLSNEQLFDIKASMNGYLEKPININKLKYYLAKSE